ncbi:Brp/Blh family beta-carotene 15,15'-dioxygenase [Algoriphagus hitonicola]|uniref:Probable beta-carotene 15,15'-dioxygenase n=1 Tax=Algoriphagus hitonicola TaxID=435880 RepID=A0A1I2WS03_9BACT|nr:Brp/Blh family beta-carotene 15,15'-dioxygenase [Algoriphagus hitonicola]SFH04148.1 beta-carotene 15,15'-monooxygenase, Brp/Blh family [Algoriphagus hitonicola]
MKSVESYFKILGILICLGFILSGSTNVLAQLGVFGVILLTIGIPHGAIDHLTSQPRQTRKSFVKFLIVYLGLIILYLGLWFSAPKLAVLLFLAFSAYHFGQTHYLNRSINLGWKEPLLFVSRGFFLLSVILFGSFDTTLQILSPILSIAFLEPYQFYVMLSFLGLTILVQFTSKISFSRSDLLDLLVLPFLLYFSPLFISFAVYFGFWHSLPSMITEYDYLSRFPQFRGTKKFITQLLPFSLISIVGIALILFLGINTLEMGELTLLFFVLISLISFPHVIYMDSFFKKSAKTDPYST